MRCKMGGGGGNYDIYKGGQCTISGSVSDRGRGVSQK